MRRFLRLGLIISIFFSLSLSKKEISLNQVTKIEPKKVVNIFFPHDGGRWTDQIVSTFTEQLAGVGLPIKFTNISWNNSSDTKDLIDQLIFIKPDLVFLPDDRLYQFLASEIEKKTSATILFSTFYSNLHELNQARKQIGIYCSAPVSNLLRHVNSIRPIRSIGIIGGPFSDKIIATILEKIGSEVKTETFKTSDWHEYTTTLKRFGDSYDAVWPLATFGVKQTDGSLVTDSQLNALITEIPKIAVGYGRISGFKRTIQMNIDPKDLGKNAAAIAFKFFKGEKPGVQEFTSYELMLHEPHIKRLNLSIPEKLHGFVTFGGE